MLDFHKENNFHEKIKPRNISNIMLVFWKFFTVLAPGVYMDDISIIICQIFQYSIQQQHDQNL